MKSSGFYYIQKQKEEGMSGFPTMLGNCFGNILMCILLVFVSAEAARQFSKNIKPQNIPKDVGAT